MLTRSFTTRRPARRAPTPASLFALVTLLAACNGPGVDTDSTSEGTTSETTTSGSTIPYVCEQYVTCYAAATPDKAAEIEAEFGEGGSCWELDAAGQAMCIDSCESGLLQYAMYFPDEPACELPETDATFELGEAVLTDIFLDEAHFEARQDGDAITLLRGGQGLQMFAIGMRGANFETAAKSTDWDDPKMPIVNMWMDVEGYNIGVGGHFARLYNYPVHFEDIGGGQLEHLYVAVIVPDEISDAALLDGLPGHLWAELRTFENPPVTRELDFVVRVELDGTDSSSTDSSGCETGGFTSGPTCP
ncbi:MAG: hypothetical protein KC468_10790 [Myxococcales bacterium]|nr:hypothetical protein [Myxococcales bacterium]